MSPDRLVLVVIIVAIVCFSGLVAQCTHKISECKTEAIKANVSPEKIPSICHV